MSKHKKRKWSEGQTMPTPDKDEAQEVATKQPVEENPPEDNTATTPEDNPRDTNDEPLSDASAEDDKAAPDETPSDESRDEAAAVEQVNETPALPGDISKEKAEIRAMVTKSVVDVLNDLNIADQISKVVNEAVEAKLKPIIDQVMPALNKGDITKIEDAPNGAKEAAGNTGGGGGIENLLMSFLMNNMGKNNSGGGGGGMAGVAEFLKAMASFQEAANSLYIAPQLQAANMLTTILKAGAAAGKTPEQLASGMDEIANGIREAARVKPHQ